MEFYYTCEYWSVLKTSKQGKIISESWIQNGGDYDTLEEALADNPPGKHKYRFIKKWFEVVAEQAASIEELH